MNNLFWNLYAFHLGNRVFSTLKTNWKSSLSPNIQNKNALPQTSISGLSNSFPLTHTSFAGYALSWLFIASNPKIYWEWSVDCQYPAWYSDLRTPPPPSVATPPPPHVGRDREWIWRWDILTITLVYLVMWAEDGRAMPIDNHVLSFDSSVTVLRSNQVVRFAWIGLPLAFVNERSRKVR